MSFSLKIKINQLSFLSIYYMIKLPVYKYISNIDVTVKFLSYNRMLHNY